MADLSSAIDRLADFLENGHLLASSDPAQMLNSIADMLERTMRGENEQYLAKKKVQAELDEWRDGHRRWRPT